MDTLALDIADSGIYAIVTPSGRKYIGSAVSFRARWKLHLINLRAGKHHCMPLQRAFRKYGESGLRFEVLERVATTDLLTREQAHIDLHDFSCLYNVNPTAGSRLGAKSSALHRARISRALKGRVMSADWIQKLKDAERPPLSEASRAKLSAALTGRKRSAESIAKQRAARNSSPYPFVILDKSRNQWIARPKVAGRYKNLGRFSSAEAAYAKVQQSLSEVR